VGITERKEKQKLEIRKKILEASMKLFTTEGFEKVSIRKIADIIEYSPTTIYLYFKDKNEILFELCEEGFIMFEKLNSNLIKINNPLNRLHKMGENYIGFGLQYPEYYDLMFIQNAPMDRLAQMNDGRWVHGDRALDLLRSIVKECITQKIIKKGDPDSVTMAVWGMVHGLVSLTIRKRFVKLVAPEKVVETMHQGISWMLKTMDQSKNNL
jgi:AcrR family transcriptional regulator